MKTNKEKMRKITINLAAVAAFCIVVASPTLVSSSCATPKTEQEDTTIIREDSGITALKYSSPEVPASIEFCGKTIDLSRFDRHERMDRELLAFTYMHSTSLQMLKKANRYFPIVEPILKENGIPDDFKYLMVIESNMNPTARSSAGAAGLWQFMQGTGRDYGLEVNNNVDERYHIEKATRAACRYLKDLYAIYNDWSLAIAAYNCGPGNVNKAIARSGGNGRTFWDIYDYLPRETRGYVPAFIGASYAYAYHRQHGIELTESPIPLATDTIRIDRLMHLGQIASTIDIPIETLRQLNPQYKLDIIPATTKPYTLVLPQRNITQYIANEPAIFAKDSAYLKEYINPANIDKKRQERSGTVYVVKKGDTLGAIARRYRVTTAQLMRWNGIKNAHKLRLGQRIRIEGR